MDFSTFNIVRGIFAVFVVLGAVQPSRSFTLNTVPANPTIVVVGETPLPVKLVYQYTLSSSETVYSVSATRQRPGDDEAAVTLGGKTGNNPYVIEKAFENIYRMENPATLVIDKVTNADEYLYHLLVTLDGQFKPQDIPHIKILVFVPPQITQHPGRKTEVDIGQNVTLQCNASGDPLPNITWTRRGVLARDFNVSGHMLHLVNVQRKDAGSYRCSATNGYGNNATTIALVSIRCSECQAENVEITINWPWKSVYSNKAAEEYKTLETNITSAIWEVYTPAFKGLSKVVIEEFREGSVIALVEMFFPQGTADPLKPLQDKIKDGRLGPYISVDPTLDLNPTTPGPLTTEPMTSQTSGITSGNLRSSTARMDEPSEDASWAKERTILYAVFLTIIFLLKLIIVVLLVLLRRKRNLQGDVNSESTRYPRQNDPVMKMPAGSEPGYQFPKLGYDGSREYMGLQPRTRSWEVEREDVQIDKIIGKGAFSQVAKATTWNINGIQGQTTLAVKMLKQNAPESDRKDLLSELELMKKLKPHPHVVKLMGCVTESDPLLVLIEYIPYGDLLGYLRKSRGLKDTYFQDPDVNPQTNLTAEQLMKYAWQIADGMCYLSSKKIIHRDLAARNVLVGEGEKCKVTDFGMARNVQQDDIYTKQSRGRLPVKWTAYEALLYGTYTTQSDVWSYGVLLYEIFTIGGSPYPGIKGREIAAKLQHGYRMPKPKHVNEQLYQIMVKCWQENPSDRPTFATLKDTMLKMSRNYKTYVNLKEYDDRLYANVDDLTMA